MGKRSDFERIEKDAYMTTDPRAVRPLLEFYGGVSHKYYEPCVGNGDLVKLLGWECVGFSDDEIDARTHKYHTMSADYFITNPPWSRDMLHPIINNLRKQLPTWLLFDSDWMFTAQSSQYMKYCQFVIPVGRLKWIPDSNNTGKDNCAWYLFIDKETPCTFIPKLDRLK
jgi:hypothetical protein